MTTRHRAAGCGAKLAGLSTTPDDRLSHTLSYCGGQYRVRAMLHETTPIMERDGSRLCDDLVQAFCGTLCPKLGAEACRSCRYWQGRALQFGLPQMQAGSSFMASVPGNRSSSDS